MRKLLSACLPLGLILACTNLSSAQSSKNDAPGRQHESIGVSGKTGHNEDVQKLTTAVNCRTLFASSGNKKIAYRTIGNGKPIILCNRLRGVLDSWDPAFLDELGKTFQVIIFDYSGIGVSGGKLPVKIADVAEDINFLASYLKLDDA